MGLVASGACVASALGGGQPRGGGNVAQIDRGEPQPRPFPFGILYKPRESQLTDTIKALAPLIIEHDPVGPRPHDSTDSPAKALELVVYAGASEQGIGGKPHVQVVFVWCQSAEVTPACESARGVRMTLGEDGFPLVWEALTHSRGITAAPDGAEPLLFVSESLEGRAAKRFGPAMPGRRFAVERESGRGPAVVEALPDGPIPMGPYVYLTARPLNDIAALACRCSPSLVSEFTSTHYYTLRPVAEAPTELAQLAAGDLSLDELLRWPPGD